MAFTPDETPPVKGQNPNFSQIVLAEFQPKSGCLQWFVGSSVEHISKIKKTDLIIIPNIFHLVDQIILVNKYSSDNI